jgi:hypothetical protein
MGYIESFNEIHRWWESLQLTHDDDKIIVAIKERIDNETDPDRLRILRHFLVKEHLAQGDQAAVEAVQRRDTEIEIHRWYSDSLRNARYDVDARPAIEDRMRSEADPRRLDILRFCLRSEHQRHGDFAAAEALLLADIAARPDEPMPLIFLAEQKLYYEEDPEAALPIIDRAIEVAMRAGMFRRHALATKARVALELKDYPAVEDVLRRIMALTFTPGNADIGVERDIFDRLPPDAIDPEVARAYDDYCSGKTRTQRQAHIDGVVFRFAQPRWLKVARIILEVLHDCERNQVETTASTIATSIRRLVEQGKLEAQGDISRWRYSEVRLSSVAAQSAPDGSVSTGKGASN